MNCRQLAPHLCRASVRAFYALFLSMFSALASAEAQVPMGVTGLMSNMSISEAAASLNVRGIASRRNEDGALQFALGDGTTKTTVRGLISFISDRLVAVDFLAEAEVVPAQYVSWLFQTAGRYGTPVRRTLTGTALSETYCYSRDVAISLELMDRKVSLSFSAAPEYTKLCSKGGKSRGFDAVAYQFPPLPKPPSETATLSTVATANRAALEQRLSELSYCHGLFMRLSSMEALPMPRRRQANDAMLRTREKGRAVQRQLGYSDEAAEQTFGHSAAMRTTGGLRTQQDFTRAVNECQAKDAA